MTAIIVRKTRFDGAIDVYNRLTLVNDIYKGKNPGVRRRIGGIDAIKWNRMRHGAMRDG